MIPEQLATRGTKTRRREIRQNIRRILGVGHEQAPNAIGALMAARELGKLVDLATAGRYGIAVYDFRSNQHLPPDKALALLHDRLDTDGHVPA